MLPLQRTLDLLDQLVKQGFSDEAFGRLHHFRATRKTNETIQKHRTYLEDKAKENLQKSVGGNNEKVQQRLELVLKSYEAGGFSSGRGETFSHLAEKAWTAIPHG